MLADMQTEIEAARALVWQAAWMRDNASQLADARPALHASGSALTLRAPNSMPEKW